MRTGLTIVAFVPVALLACGGAPSPSAPTPPRDAAVAELDSLYRARIESARARFSQADVHFMQGMIAHHTQALIMSEMAPSHGASPSVLTLTARTINAQADEIATMRRWLEDRGQVLHHDMGTMPGMLTDEQMRELDAARGRDFDRLFLTFMIQHHSGAVTMVHELFATDGAAQGDDVFKIASDIQADQTSEIRRMELMLEALSQRP